MNDSAPSPLAQLNHYIAHHPKRNSSDPLQEYNSDGMDGTDGVFEMRSVRRFRAVWARITAENQVSQALACGPTNAGPLNSHMLVLRCLKLMQSLSPEYLRRFLSHIEALLWLEQANQANQATQGKSLRRGKGRKCS